MLIHWRSIFKAMDVWVAGFIAGTFLFGIVCFVLAFRGLSGSARSGKRRSDQ
jgi:hypothetical protein